MPRIPDQHLDCVVYLYPSAEAADEGRDAGGSGFLASCPWEQVQGRDHCYIVTNSHVIREAKSPVVRLNTHDGSKDIINLKESDWMHHPDGDDIAVSYPVMPWHKYKTSHIPVEMFVNKQIIEDNDIGPGDDVYMLGRFVDHEGRQKNLPSLRFGNIAMMPWEPALHPRKILQESFLVETHSIGGFSGSPVLLLLNNMVKRKKNPGQIGPWLLGVDWGHIPLYEKVRDGKTKEPVPEGWVVRANTGMMGVVPAWRLAGFLNSEEMIMQRRELEQVVLEEQSKERSGFVLDAERESTSSQQPDNPQHKEDFDRLLSRAVKGKK
jgi:hypothetical protein